MDKLFVIILHFIKLFNRYVLSLVLQRTTLHWAQIKLNLILQKQRDTVKIQNLLIST